MYRLIFKTAILTLFRRKLRTFLAIFMIASSLWGLMLMLGIYDGMVKQMIDNAIRSDSGHISLYQKGFREENEIQNHIQDPSSITTFLSQNPHIKSHVQRVVSDGLIATAKYSRGIKIYGIDLESEKRQAHLERYLFDGVYGFGAHQNGVLLGHSLAKKLKVSIGKKVILSAQDSTGEINSIARKVTGILKTNNMHMDSIAVFMPLQQAQAFLSINGVMQISLQLKDTTQLQALQQRLQERFEQLEIFTWEMLYPALIQSKVIMEQYGLISYILIFFIAGIGIFGVILVSVLERLREFAILKAIGTPFSTVSHIVFWEALFIGLAGFILGSLLGGGTLYYFHIYGLDLSTFSDALDTFGMDAITYALIKPSYFVTGFFAVIVAVLLSILFPLRVLKKSKPIEVING